MLANTNIGRFHIIVIGSLASINFNILESIVHIVGKNTKRTRECEAESKTES